MLAQAVACHLPNPTNPGKVTVSHCDGVAASRLTLLACARVAVFALTQTNRASVDKF